MCIPEPHAEAGAGHVTRGAEQHDFADYPPRPDGPCENCGGCRVGSAVKRMVENTIQQDRVET